MAAATTCIFSIIIKDDPQPGGQHILQPSFQRNLHQSNTGLKAPNYPVVLHH